MIGKTHDPAVGTTAKGPSDEVLAFIRALARRRARLDAAPKEAANENIQGSGGIIK
jgi:hypothetical protein